MLANSGNFWLNSCCSFLVLARSGNFWLSSDLTLVVLTSLSVFDLVRAYIWSPFFDFRKLPAIVGLTQDWQNAILRNESCFLAFLEPKSVFSWVFTFSPFFFSENELGSNWVRNGFGLGSWNFGLGS